MKDEVPLFWVSIALSQKRPKMSNFSKMENHGKTGKYCCGCGCGCIYSLSSKSGGSSTPDEPSTLEFILIRSSFVKSPLHILFSICPYSGSSLKRCSLSKMITALMQFSQCLLERLENRSSVSLTPMGSSCEYSHDLWAHNLIRGEKRKKPCFSISENSGFGVSLVLFQSFKVSSYSILEFSGLILNVTYFSCLLMSV